jgi:hypothetical protein
VAYKLIAMEPKLRQALEALGLAVRYARSRAGISQDILERLSEVDQSAISRFERGLAPSFSAVKLVSLSLALRGALPLGVCPHDHTCPWRPPELAPPPAEFEPVLTVPRDDLPLVEGASMPIAA